jgi:hypothetical protein
MESMICPNTPRCPIFNGILKGTEYTTTYKSLYCEAGQEGREKCRRFQVASITCICPPDILPNSTKSVDEIVANMKEKGMIQ